MAISAIHNTVKFFVGDTVKVNYKIREKDGKDRIQAFDGVVLAIQGAKEDCRFIVQKKATDGIKVERIFPINSPWIESVKKLRSPKKAVRRAKLYFLREEHHRSV